MHAGRRRAGALCVLLALMVCGTAAAQDALRIVSPHPPALRDEFDTGFKAWVLAEHGLEAEIEWMDQGGTSNIVRFINSEYKRAPEGINVDIFFGGGTDSYIQLVRDGYLETYAVPDDILDAVQPDIFGVPMIDPGRQWYGVALAGFGIMHNKLLARRFKLPEVKTWEDLTNPGLQGRIATADPRNSGSAHMVYEIILQAYGWEKGWQVLQEMGGNVKAFTTGASDVPNEVALGNVVYGPVIDFYAYAQILQTGEDKLGYVTPDGLSVINADPIGILKGAPRLELAQRFVDFCLTPTAQKLLMLPMGHPDGPRTGNLARASVLPALYDELGDAAIVGENPFALENTIKYDATKGGKRWGLVNDLYGTLIIDTHKELTTAWKAVGKSQSEDGRAILGKMPLTEAEATELAAGWGSPDNALARKGTISDWRRFARDKYQAARKMK